MPPTIAYYCLQFINMFYISIGNGLKAYQIEEYETLIARLLRQKTLPTDPATAIDIAVR